MLLVLTVVAARPAAAHAGIDNEEPPRAVPQLSAPGTTEPASALDEPRSPRTARLLSGAGPLMSLGVVAVGGLVAGAGSNPAHWRQDLGAGIAWVGVASLPLAPSFGHWYAGDYLTPGLGLRALGIGLFVGGAANYTLRIDCADLDCPPAKDNTLGGTLMLLGLVSYTTGWFYDVATAGRAAREYNRGHSRLSIAPTAIRGASATSYGLVVGGSF
ncbi:MAG: hypothetical protein ACM31C_14830 [Acidobacteriota bacterium]